MTNKEIAKEELNIFSGILFNNQHFEDGINDEITYDFNCKEYQLLKEKYNIEEIAKSGTDFERGKRLLNYLAPRLTHLPWYDNHVPCNSLDLLEYSLNNPNHGINCLNKAKILEECCLAIGIYARRVRILPYSPYDYDSHVVTEIFDRTLNKWIMLDPTTNGYFIDENKTPLSLLEMRERFAKAEFVTYIPANCRIKDLNKIREKYIEANAYISKNLFYFYIDKYSTFGDKIEKLAFIPKNFSTKKLMKAGYLFKLNNLSDEIDNGETDQESWKEYYNKKLEEIDKLEEIINDLNSMIKAPI